jgi:hypothetical protein
VSGKPTGKSRLPYRPRPGVRYDRSYGHFLWLVRRAFGLRLNDVAPQLNRSAYYLSTLERRGCDEATAILYLTAIAATHGRIGIKPSGR